MRFELLLLGELGFGLDLATCVVSGRTDDLVYVSPKSGRAVSRREGEPWKDKLLALPAFLRELCDPSPQDIADGFALTGSSCCVTRSSRAASALPMRARISSPQPERDGRDAPAVG